MFVNLVTSLDSYKTILSHYVLKESQKGHVTVSDGANNISEQFYTLPLFTEECMAAYYSNTELPFPLTCRFHAITIYSSHLCLVYQLHSCTYLKTLGYLE